MSTAAEQFFNFLKRRQPRRDVPAWKREEIVIHGSRTTYEELEHHASRIAEESPSSPERGLAMSVLFLLDVLAEFHAKEDSDG